MAEVVRTEGGPHGGGEVSTRTEPTVGTVTNRRGMTYGGTESGAIVKPPRPSRRPRQS